jgi:hypothetical protein
MDKKQAADQILKVGIPLSQYSYTNWGLTREQALEAFRKLRILRVPVLGGDVLTKHGNEWTPTYDNWYVNRESGETNDAYTDRSIRESEEYVRSCAPEDSGTVLFAIVVGAY